MYRVHFKIQKVFPEPGEIQAMMRKTLYLIFSSAITIGQWHLFPLYIDNIVISPVELIASSALQIRYDSCKVNTVQVMVADAEH